MAKLNLERDPRLYQPRHLVDDHKRCIGIDLGTSCGIAIADFVPGQPVRKVDMLLGQWDLSVGDYETNPLRFIRLKQFLSVARPDLVMFEDVKNTPSQEQMNQRGYDGVAAIVARVATASELLGGFKVILTTWCEERGIPAHPLPIQHIKKHATGKGNCGKPEMIRACNEKFGTDFDPSEDVFKREGTDNMADAAFACDLGLLLYSDGMT